jgi:Zn-dependent protease
MDLTLQAVSFIISIGALICAITIHEFAHALLADHLGDPTPRLQHRLTLNPLAHLDLLGSIMLFLVHFGWGKPVQFDPFNLRHPRRDAAIISVAGPIANLLLAVTSALFLRLLPLFTHSATYSPLTAITIAFLHMLVIINVNLAIFNLIPIHPLDGFKIVGGLLTKNLARQWYALERYGFLLLILLMFPLFGSAPLYQIIIPVVDFIVSLLLPGSAGLI